MNLALRCRALVLPPLAALRQNCIKFTRRRRVRVSTQTNSAGGVVGVDGDALFLVRGCVVCLPVVDEEAVLRDEALDHLRNANEQAHGKCMCLFTSVLTTMTRLSFWYNESQRRNVMYLLWCVNGHPIYSGRIPRRQSTIFGRRGRRQDFVFLLRRLRGVPAAFVLQLAVTLPETHAMHHIDA